MFEAAPRRLRIHETRALLLGSAQRLDTFDPLRAGAGLLDTVAAVRAAMLVDAEPQPAGDLHAQH
jgi:hypothetical protein